MNGKSRAVREQEVLSQLEKRWAAHSSHELARKIGLKPSAHARAIFYKMYCDKKIGGFTSTKENGKDVYYWYAIDRDERFGQQSFLEMMSQQVGA